MLNSDVQAILDNEFMDIPTKEQIKIAHKVKLYIMSLKLNIDCKHSKLGHFYNGYLKCEDCGEEWKRHKEGSYHVRVPKSQRRCGVNASYKLLKS